MRGVETGENKDVKNSKIQFNNIKMKAPGYSFSKKKIHWLFHTQSCKPNARLMIVLLICHQAIKRPYGAMTFVIMLIENLPLYEKISEVCEKEPPSLDWLYINSSF